MNAVKTPQLEPIPGYRLLELLGRGGYGEVWKCTAPGGLTKAIKFVAPGDSISDDICAATQELQALEHIKQIRHPFLLSIERVEVIEGEVMIVMELADRSLHDLLHDYRKDGKVGIPRGELINYFRDVAEALDLLNLEHGLQHLDVKPRNLFLVGRHVKVADFGLVNSLAERYGNNPEKVQQQGVATPVYSSPESFLGRITLFSDQYSLAVSYCELLTGAPPFSGKNYRQLALQHTGTEPDLSQLPEHDRAAVARSLAKEPGNRFRSCLDFIRALEEAAPVTIPVPSPSRLIRTLKSPTGQNLKLEKLSSTPAAGAEMLSQPAGAGNMEATISGNSRLTETGKSLSSYSFLECLSRLPIGEVWKGERSDGRRCLIKLIFNCPAADETNKTGAISRLAALRHPALEPFVIVRDGANRIALILDERDGTLADRLNECRTAGLPGVSRDELIRYLKRTAETLDELERDQDLQHLMLNPRSLILDRGLLRIADFGLAQLIWLPAGLEAGKLNTRYAPPELFEGRVTPACDQYSLALIYQELLTGMHAFRNLSPRQLATPKLRGDPDLELLPASDRSIVGKALDPRPTRRYATCMEFITALEKAGTRPVWMERPSSTIIRISTPALIPASAPLPPLLSSSQSLEQVKEILDQARGGTTIRELKGFRFRVIADSLMEHHFTACFLQGTLPIKLEGFRRHWIGKVINSSDNEVVYHISPPVKGLMARWRQQPTLKLHVVHTIRPESASVVGIAVTLQPLPGGEHLLEELGPRIFDSIRQFLQAVPDRRREERYRLGKPLRVIPVFGESEPGEGIVAQALDISQTGLGFFLPCRPASTDVLLEVGLHSGTPPLLPATIVRADRCSDGRYLIGVAFHAAPTATEAAPEDGSSILDDRKW